MKKFEIKKLSNLDEIEFHNKIKEIYELTKFLEIQYPNYKDWFYNKAIERIPKQEGEIFFIEEKGLIRGITILKKTETEKKICTLFVEKEFRNLGIGNALLSESFKYLETKKPTLTIPQKNIECFSHLIDKYKWEKTGIINSYKSTEIVLNKKEKD